MSGPPPADDDELIRHMEPAWRNRMSRYDRAQYFEALVCMRAAYSAASDFDRRPVISMDDAIGYAEAVMFAVSAEAEEALVLDELKARQQPMAFGDPRD
jgi:hypothetical protein